MMLKVLTMTWEQYTRKFNLAIHGIPECEEDNVEDVINFEGQLNTR